jgi:hypothetical protein
MWVLYLLIFALIYTFVGALIGKRYWERRHGVYKRVIGGGADALFSSVTPFMFLWPIFLFVPKFQNPELCECRDHVIARANARREAEAHQQGLREERQDGR